MIFLDEARFIGEAVESVVAQTDTRWELLLVDDGSTDGSTDIARRWAERMPGRIRHLEHPGHANRGMSASRNLGLAHAAGGLVTFLDADDVFTPAKLAEQAAILDAHPEVGLVCGRAELWHSWSGAPGTRDTLQELGLPEDQPVPGIRLLSRFLVDEHASPCDVMVRRPLAVSVGGYEESFRGMYEDQAFHAKLCLAGTSAWVSGSRWYRYRQHAEACTARSKRTGGYRPARLAFLDWVEGRSAGITGADREVLDHALGIARWPFEHPLRARAEDARRWVRSLSSRWVG
jgi:glycosyltransferase involved in cell wall biosynthesis